MVIAAAAVSCLALLPVTSAQGAVRARWATPRPGSTYSLAFRFQSQAGESGHPREPIAAEPVTACERKLERALRQRQPHVGSGVPALAIVGASFTAGVGPGNPGKSWAVVLARLLHWDAVIYGDPGAGYVRAGVGRMGPVAAEIARLDLRALAPALVIVQAGHDDIGVPLRLEQRRVQQAIALIHAEAPRARIALLTVFAARSGTAARRSGTAAARSGAAAGRSGRAAAYRTDHAIVTAGRAADRNVIIIDPLAAGWTFPRSHDGLHPTAPGSVWIAGQVAGILREHGVRPAPSQPDKAGAIICDWSTPAPAPRR
jgi:lysophospholipase L1-like esterase